MVVPKRHVKRAVTRNLIRREVRHAAQAVLAGGATGVWVVRLRQGFDTQRWPAAWSQPLQVAVRSELTTLFVEAGL
jgi:ribonuclease P protein component